MLFIEMFTLSRAWNGLTDDELVWLPAADAWTVGPATECRTATPFVTGELAAVSHHGTQICVLRDLYRQRSAT